MEEQQLHLNVGLAKIQETVEQVEELQASLSVKKIELEKKNALANQKLKQMVSIFSCSATCMLLINHFSTASSVRTVSVSAIGT